MNKKIMLLFSSLFMLFGMSNTVLAKSNNTISDGYTIEGISNKDQQKDAKNKPYFYLYKQPGQSGSISVKILNGDTKAHNYTVTIGDANTNKNGVMDYLNEEKNSKYLKTPLTSLTNWKKKDVSVPARGSKVVTVDYTMPKNHFDGIIDGAISVFQNEQEKGKVNNHIAMGSRYGYTLGIILTNTNTFDPYKSLSVQLTTVTPKIDYGSKVVIANLLNNNPYIFGPATVKGKVTNLDRNKVVATTEMSNVKIAPNQEFPFQLNWGNQDMEPGNYLLKGVVKVKNKEWPFERKFTIEKKVAKQLNKKAVFKVYIPKWLNISIYILAVLTTIVTIYLFIRKYKRGKKEDEDIKKSEI